jgi:enoyl-CoA hydratase
MNVEAENPVRLDFNEKIAVVTLNRPPYHPMSMAVIDRLEQIFADLERETETRAIVFTSEGDKAFSVGADIREFGASVAGMGLEKFIQQRLSLAAKIEHLRKPVVCAIPGACMGGGLEFALACHFRLASDKARLGLPEIELGIVPAWGGTQRLTRTVGRAHALDLMLRAKKIDANEALRIGLVHEVCHAGSLQDRALELAHELADKAPIAMAGILKAVIEGEALSLDEGLKLEFQAVEACGQTEDSREGVLAFLEKRKPVFHGR